MTAMQWARASSSLGSQLGIALPPFAKDSYRPVSQAILEIFEEPELRHLTLETVV